MMKYIKKLKLIIDILLTLLLWIYFIFGFIIFFFPLYLYAFIKRDDRGKRFQELNYFFFRIFFYLVRILTPGVRFNIPNDILTIKSSIIICNHLSYLDPILFISLFRSQRTIVKAVFFKVPIFGWVLNNSEYIPSSEGEGFNRILSGTIRKIKRHLSDGGILFIFPEGTRSRDGRLAKFRKGAFKIAKKCEAPIELLFIKNTNALFKPGRFSFNTCVKNLISIERIGKITPDYKNKKFSLLGLIKQIESIYYKKSLNR